MSFKKGSDSIGLIALRCPQCGGEINLESAREIGFCMYCGSKVIIQEAINQRVMLDESHKIDAWITLGIEAIKSKNHSDAENYANKIIEADLKNPGGWYIKGCCATTVETAVQYWYKALEYAKKDTPLWNDIITAINHPWEHFHRADQVSKQIRNVTFARSKAMGGAMRNFHISINGVEKVVLGNGESRSIMLEEGAYVLKGRISSYSISVPLNVNKDMVVCINLNQKDQKWDIVSS